MSRPIITPEASEAVEAQDTLRFPASNSAIRAFNRLRNNHSNQAKAMEVFRGVERLKEQIGVGLDAGGCRLATPARNARVSDDEGVYVIVPDGPEETARAFGDESESGGQSMEG